ncbi:H-NS family nucleoid-associated regulatory protein [Variovorax sp. GB1P17]|uniref:H-NS family nucleoid-associated regulatory protein n=1 Tax=Variovorax sp. GB1P17 TaxID=3443740 RepID=UPI003F466ED9
MAQKSYAQIQRQIETLQRQADELRAQEVEGVVARIKEAIAHYGLTAEQLGYGATLRVTRTKAQKVSGANAPAYSDGLGNTWGGRGPRPQWLRTAIAEGKSLQDFASSRSSVPAKARKASKNAKAMPAKKRSATTYRDEAGNTWSGFGPRPRWLREALEAGQTLEQLAATGT